MQINERAMIVVLSIGQWTARKTDKKATKEVTDNHGTTEDWGKFNKTLLARDATESLSKIATEARSFHYENSLPWDDRGGRILPSAHYMEYTAAMRQYKERFFTEVSKVLDNYNALKDQARQNLNGLFREDDYPTLEKVQRKYTFEVEVQPIPTGNDFRCELDTDQVNAIQKQIEERVQTTTRAAMRDLWQRLFDAVSHMADRLSTKDAIFRDSLLGNVADLCALLPKLNFANDPNLEAMRAEIESKLTTTTAGTLRNNDLMREKTAADARAIIDKMSAFMQ